tara:strand:+ start:4360 stop:5307 length:948 start_codon:yes stop_codon:yes gene_type:complete
MFGTPFYNEGLRKIIIAFGQLFNNIVIESKNKDTGAVLQRIKVPLAYAPKEKFLVRLDQQAELNDRSFAVTLPRMGFEISGLSYDPSRKLTRMQKFKHEKTPLTRDQRVALMDQIAMEDDSGFIMLEEANTATGNAEYPLLETSQTTFDDSKKASFNWTPVPYNISLNVYCFTATAENGLQIVEQILPFFQPDYTVTVNVLPEMGMKRDVPIILNTINYEDSYDGAFTNRRAVIYTMNFTAKTYLFGPTTNQGVIKKVQSDLYADTDTVNTPREERITVIPNPPTADVTDDFGFTTTVQNFTDGKKYNTTTGSDE